MFQPKVFPFTCSIRKQIFFLFLSAIDVTGYYLSVFGIISIALFVKEGGYNNVYHNFYSKMRIIFLYIAFFFYTLLAILNKEEVIKIYFKN